MTAREVTILLIAAAVFHFLSSSFLRVGFYLDVMLAATVYIANYSDPARAALLGCMFGLVQDVAGLHAMWGLNGFSKTLIGFAGCYLIRYLVLETRMGKAALLFVLSLLDVAIIHALLWLLTESLTDGLVGHALLKAVFTALSGTALFYLLDRMRFQRQDYSHL